ncbi:hypothetical protein C8R42DRAFT_717503 [Lentinula raphanica]|nr:hypothetical protein C8R42DRAFT_717503 [Lentinula raphanica]
MAPSCLPPVERLRETGISSSSVMIVYLLRMAIHTQELITSILQFPANGFDVNSHMTANPSRYSSRLDQADHGHYVSNPYNASESALYNGTSFLRDQSLVSKNIRFRTESDVGLDYYLPTQGYSQTTMDHGDFVEATICDFMHDGPAQDQHYVAGYPYQNFEQYSSPLPSSQQIGNPPGDHHYFDHELRLPPTSPRVHTYSFPQSFHSSFNHAADSYLDSPYLSRTYSPPSPISSDVSNAHMMGTQSFTNGGDSTMGHTSDEIHNLHFTYSRLQDRRPTEYFYQPEARYTVGPNMTPTIDSLFQRDTPKKQTLACLFCRERKIACGRPVPGSFDMTCNQCARRNLPCTYPTESRRGQHKRKSQKGRDARVSRE